MFESTSETLSKPGISGAGHWRYLLLGAVVVGNFGVLKGEG
jgi:hypothetical protein